MNEGRIYRYRQLLEGINNSIIASIEHSIAIGKKYQTLENFNATQTYITMTKGAWLGISPMIDSECTEKEKDKLWFYWNYIISSNWISWYFEED